MKLQFSLLAEQILNDMAYGMSASSEEITVPELEQMIVSFDEASLGNRFISLTSITNPKNWARGVPFKSIYKVSQYTAMLGGDYAKRVNDQLAREGKPADFEPQPNIRVEYKISKSLWHFKNGTNKIAVFPEKAVGSFYFVEDQNGLREVQKSEVQQYLPPPEPPSTSQGTDKSINIRTPDVRSVRAISIEGKEYNIVSDNEVYNQIFDAVKDRLKS